MALTTLCKQSHPRKFTGIHQLNFSTIHTRRVIIYNGNIRAMAHAITGRPLTKGVRVNPRTVYMGL